MGRNDFCFCGSGEKQKKCHSDIDERSMAASIFRFYHKIDTKVEDHYSKSSLMHQCKKGCSECCYNQTPISEIEFNVIQYQILKLPQNEIEKLKKRVENLWNILCNTHPEFVKELEKSYQGQMISGTEANQKFYTDFSDLPCPLLDSDTKECLVYSVRPFICRAYGVSYKDDDPDFDMCSKLDSSKVKVFGCNFNEFRKEVLGLVLWENNKGQILARRPYPLIYHCYKSFNHPDGFSYINNFTGKFQMPEDIYKQKVFEHMYKTYVY